MVFKKFEQDDILYNTIIVNPRNTIFIKDKKTYLKNTIHTSKDTGSAPNFLYINSISGSTLTNSDTDVVFAASSELDRYSGNAGSFSGIPSSSISLFYVADATDSSYTDTTTIGTTQRRKITALKNTIDWYSSVSPSYNYSNFSSNEVAIINIPSIFYGNSIKRSSVSLDFYYTGSLLAKAEDIYSNGQLIETTGSNAGKVAGIVLYDEGVILLTGSWDLKSSLSDNYIYYYDSATSTETNTNSTPKWIYWGKSYQVNLDYSSFQISFEGIDKINTITMFAYADKNEFNTSNNKTFLSHSQDSYSPDVNPSYFKEYEKIAIKNTVKTSYEDVSGSFEKQTFISSIGIYDENKNLIAIAKLATPIKKTNDRDYMFKLKLDV